MASDDSEEDGKYGPFSSGDSFSARRRRWKAGRVGINTGLAALAALGLGLAALEPREVAGAAWGALKPIFDSPVVAVALFGLCLGVCGVVRLAARVSGVAVAAVPGQHRGRWLYLGTFIYVNIIVFRAPFTWEGNWWWASFLLWALLPFCDFLVSDKPWRNLETLRANGYGSLHVALSYLMFTVRTLSAIYSTVPYFGEIPRFPTAPGENSPVSLWLGLILNLSFAEACFTGSHMLMHFWLPPRVHRMHHCCTEATLSTMWCFHPVDYLIEAVFPFIGLLPSLAWVYTEPVGGNWLLFVSGAIVNIWYFFVHDETLDLPHSRHHYYIDSVFTIYGEVRQGDAGGADRIKPAVTAAVGDRDDEGGLGARPA